MDVIPTFKFVIGIMLFGLSFYFLNLGVNEVYSQMGLSNQYMSAILWLWSALPGVALMGSSLRHIMVMQKRRPGY